MSDTSRYSGISTINHWITALLVVAMMVLGFTAGAAPSDAIEDYVLGIHISLGFFVLIFVIWRVVFRLYEGFPLNTGRTVFERWAAYFVHRAILVLLVIQVITGPLYLFTENDCMAVFGWFSVCLPLETLAIIHEPVESIHVYGGVYLLPALLVVHVIAGIRHYITSGPRDTPAGL